MSADGHKMAAIVQQGKIWTLDITPATTTTKAPPMTTTTVAPPTTTTTTQALCPSEHPCSQCIDPSDKCKCPQDKIDQGFCGGAPGCYSEEGITKSICENSGDIWCPDCNKISPAPSPSPSEEVDTSASPPTATAQ